MDTFVVRLWTPAPSAGDPATTQAGVHGTAQHVGSGRSATFRDGQELLDALAVLGGGGAQAVAEQPGTKRDADVPSTGR